MFRQKKKKMPYIKLILLLAIMLFVLFKSHDLAKQIYPFPYRESITHHAIANNIDPYLLAALIKTESNFNPEATSPAGARGLLQIMPDTGMWIADQMGRTDFNPDQLYNPEISINMGAWYLSNLKKEFPGDQALILAAYNAGRGNVSNWLENGYWTGETKNIDQIPFAETRHYVRKIMWNYKVYKLLYDGTNQ
ncbi:lytic transglycosylase domain-containing protein [Desulfofalx alkaliphila]|uniref:lytic transglycosylase domain-containing protein n=1 Tax=Desulfofalx alkaliphila TaxID=105483 RepID=UPI000B2666A1